MNYKNFELHFSKPRVNRYYYAAGSSRKKAIRMYKQNLLVAQSIHPVIGVFEVVLRNSIYNAISNYFQDENWIVNQKEGFMSDKAYSNISRFTSGNGTKGNTEQPQCNSTIQK